LNPILKISIKPTVSQFIEKCDTLKYSHHKIHMPNPEDNNTLLIKAASEGNAAEVRRLIPISDPKGKGGDAMAWAARFGHTQCVELLIPVSDPKAWGSEALRWAVENGHTQCVEFLYPVSEPMVALKHLQQNHPNDYNAWGQLYEMIEAERLNATLHSEICGPLGTKSQRKM
jgi:ankyrin repeat protein